MKVKIDNFVKIVFGNDNDVVKLSQTKLSEKINVSLPAINYWKNNPGSITLKNLRLVTKAMNLSDEEIVRIVRNK